MKLFHLHCHYLVDVILGFVQEFIVVNEDSGTITICANLSTAIERRVLATLTAVDDSGTSTYWS